MEFSRSERIDEAQSAIELLGEAIEALRVAGGNQSQRIIESLETAIDGQHNRYDANIQSLIEEIKEEYEV